MTSGIDYPKVTVDGQTLTVRFSLFAQYLLSMQGINVRNLLPESHAGFLMQRMQLFAAAVAESYSDGSKLPDPEMRAPGAIKWAKRIGVSDWPLVLEAIESALGKASEELSMGTPATAPQTEPTSISA